MKEYATSRVANLLPHLGYRFIHALEASPVHRRQTFQGKALQVNLRGLDRRMPQQLTDHLDRYVLFLQGRGERVYEVTGSPTPQVSASDLKSRLKRSKAPLYSA